MCSCSRHIKVISEASSGVRVDGRQFALVNPHFESHSGLGTDKKFRGPQISPG